MKKDNIPGLEGYYISRLGTLWSRYHKSGKLTHSENQIIIKKDIFLFRKRVNVGIYIG